MNVIDPGHLYELDSYDGDCPQVLQFMKREGEDYPGNVGHYPGTNCQEVLRALIHRVQYLDNQFPCAENQEILQLARRMLWLFEVRAAKRKYLPPPSKTMANIERKPTCPQCGHITCLHF